VQSLLTKIVYAIVTAALDAWLRWRTQPHVAEFLDAANEHDRRIGGDLYERLRRELDRIPEPPHEDIQAGKTNQG
jgi:hypothetical protein